MHPSRAYARPYVDEGLESRHPFSFQPTQPDRNVVRNGYGAAGAVAVYEALSCDSLSEADAVVNMKLLLQRISSAEAKISCLLHDVPERLAALLSSQVYASSWTLLFHTALVCRALALTPTSLAACIDARIPSALLAVLDRATSSVPAPPKPAPIALFDAVCSALVLLLAPQYAMPRLASELPLAATVGSVARVVGLLSKYVTEDTDGGANDDDADRRGSLPGSSRATNALADGGAYAAVSALYPDDRTPPVAGMVRAVNVLEAVALSGVAPPPRPGAPRRGRPPLVVEVDQSVAALVAAAEAAAPPAIVGVAVAGPDGADPPLLEGPAVKAISQLLVGVLSHRVEYLAESAATACVNVAAGDVADGDTASRTDRAVAAIAQASLVLNDGQKVDASTAHCALVDRTAGVAVTADALVCACVEALVAVCGGSSSRSEVARCATFQNAIPAALRHAMNAYEVVAKMPAAIPLPGWVSPPLELPSISGEPVVSVDRAPWRPEPTPLSEYLEAVDAADADRVPSSPPSPGAGAAGSMDAVGSGGGSMNPVTGTPGGEGSGVGAAVAVPTVVVAANSANGVTVEVSNSDAAAASTATAADTKGGGAAAIEGVAADAAVSMDGGAAAIGSGLSSGGLGSGLSSGAKGEAQPSQRGNAAAPKRRRFFGYAGQEGAPLPISERPAVVRVVDDCRGLVAANSATTATLCAVVLVEVEAKRPSHEARIEAAIAKGLSVGGWVYRAVASKAAAAAAASLGGGSGEFGASPRADTAQSTSSRSADLVAPESVTSFAAPVVRFCVHAARQLSQYPPSRPVLKAKLSRDMQGQVWRGTPYEALIEPAADDGQTPSRPNSGTSARNQPRNSAGSAGGGREEEAADAQYEGEE